MSVKFEVKMTEKAMYDFLLYHTYTHVNGLLGALIGAAFLVIAGYKGVNGEYDGIVLFVGMGLLMLLMTPLSLRSSARNQVKNTKMFQEPLKYEMTEEGLSVEQNGEKALNPWDEFEKAVSTGHSLILYVTRVRAIILPKDQLGDDYMAAVKMISTHIPPKRVKIRHVK